MIIRKFIAAIIAGIIYVVILPAIDNTPMSERHFNYSFPSLLDAGILYIFVFIGIPLSLLLDSFINRFKYKKFTKYALSIVLYAIGGIVAIFILLFAISGGGLSASKSTHVFFPVVLASLLLLHFSLLVDRIENKIKKR